MLNEHLVITPSDFAFTGTSWSSQTEKLFMKRYRTNRLWIAGNRYQVNGRERRYANLVGAEGPDELDGGPPTTARYITEHCPRYRLPSTEIQDRDPRARGIPVLF